MQLDNIGREAGNAPLPCLFNPMLDMSGKLLLWVRCSWILPNPDPSGLGQQAKDTP